MTKDFLKTVVLSVVLAIPMSCDESVPFSPDDSSTEQFIETQLAQQSALLLDYTFDGTEGDPIPREIVQKWSANYAADAQLSIRSHFFSSENIKSILALSGCIGIRFYYALDDGGVRQLLMVGSTVKGKNLFSPSAISGMSSSIDVNSSNSINDLDKTGQKLVTESTYKEWTQNYRNERPADLRAHFFGWRIVRQILAEKGCVGLRAYYALDDSGVQQLLLVGVNANGENLLPSSNAQGRVTDDDDGNIAADVSFPCPAACPPEE